MGSRSTAAHLHFPNSSIKMEISIRKIELFKFFNHDDQVAQNSKYLMLQVCIFFVFNGLILINRGLFWDDWYWFNNVEVFGAGVRELGIYVTGHLMVLVSMLPEPYSVLVSRILIFLFFLGAQLFLYQFLVDNEYFSRQQSFFIALIFGNNPLNISKYLFCNLHYGFAYFLFFWGLYLTRRAVHSRGLLRILVLSIFYISFFTSSLLVFYLLVLSHIVWLGMRTSPEPFSLFRACRVLRSNIDFVLLPVMFWIIRAVYFHPSGEYATDYNVVDLTHFYISLSSLYRYTFLFNLIRPITDGFSIVPIGVAAWCAILVCLVGYAIWRYANDRNRLDPRELKFEISVLLVGLAAFSLAIIPYVAVGKVPDGSSWGARHQLLVPLGFSLIIYSILSIASRFLSSNRRVKYFAMSAILVIFAFRTNAAYFQYQVDWYKQRAMIENFRGSPIVRDNTTFAIRDNAKDLDLFGGRYYRMYEWTGLFTYAFENQSRIASEDLGLFPYKVDQSPSARLRNLKYKVADYPPPPRGGGSPQYVITVEKNANRDIRDLPTLGKLLYLEYFDPQKFSVAVKDAVLVTFKPFSG